MIDYINLLLLLTMFGSTCYIYYRLKKFFYLISIIMDSEILDQLTSLEQNMNSEVTKPKRGRKKKADSKETKWRIVTLETRERETSCVCSIW